MLNISKTKLKKIKEKDLINLKVNDIINYNSKNYKILGKIYYSENFYGWINYYLDKELEGYWLSIKEDNMSNISLYKSIPKNHKIYSRFSQVNTVKSPVDVPKEIEYLDKIYILSEVGVANINASGCVNTKTAQSIDYAVYEYLNGKSLSVEWWTELKISEGQKVANTLIKY